MRDLRGVLPISPRCRRACERPTVSIRWYDGQDHSGISNSLDPRSVDPQIQRQSVARMRERFSLSGSERGGREKGEGRSYRPIYACVSTRGQLFLFALLPCFRYILPSSAARLSSSSTTFSSTRHLSRTRAHRHIILH